MLSKRLPDPVRNVLFSTANPLTWWAVFRDVARVVTGGSSAEALVGSTRDLQQPVHPPATEL